jgi:hypothetical protein
VPLPAIGGRGWSIGNLLMLLPADLAQSLSDAGCGHRNDKTALLDCISPGPTIDGFDNSPQSDCVSRLDYFLPPGYTSDHWRAAVPAGSQPSRDGESTAGILAGLSWERCFRPDTPG